MLQPRDQNLPKKDGKASSATVQPYQQRNPPSARKGHNISDVVWARLDTKPAKSSDVSENCDAFRVLVKLLRQWRSIVKGCLWANPLQI